MATLSHERRTWMPAYALSIQVLMTVLLGIRLVSRFQRMGGRLGLDDVFISIAWIIATAGIVLTTLGKVNYSFVIQEETDPSAV